MGKQAAFKTNPIGLEELLRHCGSGKIQLPDFQRSWVWDEERIKGLIASISQAFPVGALMTLEVKPGAADTFARSPIQGADPMIGGLIFIALCLLGAIFFLQAPAIAAGVAGGASAGLADFANAAALGSGGPGRARGPQEAGRQPPRGGGTIRPKGA